MKRGLIIGGAVVIAAVIILVVFVFSSLDSLIKAGVETYGTEITQATVTLETVELDITSGQGALAGLVVGNPKGFQTPSAFKLGRISITIDTSTVTSDPVVIKEIVITKPDVTYELGPGGNNIDAIQNNVNAYMAKFGGGKKAKGDAKDSAKGDEGPKLIIRDLYIRDGTVNVSAAILKGKKMSVPLPNIHLKDIGGKKKGATPGEVAEKILTSISKGASGAVAGIGIGKTLESLESSLSGVTKGISGATKDIGSGIESGAQDVGKKLKGLFGN